jgi:acetyl esterase
MSPLHPALARFLAAVRAAGRPAFQDLTPVEARAAYAAGRPLLQSPPEDVADVRDVTIPGPGGPLTLRIYRGDGCDDAGPQPCLLFLHGGGWVIGDLDSHDGLCRRLANAASCRVVAVDYRLAPEHPFPAALDDASAALRWLVHEAGTLGIDPARLAIGGDSAGGNLAAVLALMGRDGTLPATAFQLLLYPVLDVTMASASYARVTEGVPLTAATMRYFADHYLPAGLDRTDWRASPLRAASLAGTPPAFVLTVAQDPLADEGRAYAARLEAEGVRVTALHVSDQIHGMLMMGQVLPIGAPVACFAAAVLRDGWDGPGGF